MIVYHFLLKEKTSIAIEVELTTIGFGLSSHANADLS
jgi:hypothetical protein